MNQHCYIWNEEFNTTELACPSFVVCSRPNVHADYCEANSDQIRVFWLHNKTKIEIYYCKKDLIPIRKFIRINFKEGMKIRHAKM
jgi:hypothetical protein